MSNVKPELCTLGRKLKEGTHFDRKPRFRPSPSPPTSISLLSPTPPLPRRSLKRQWLVRSISPIEFKFPNKPKVGTPLPISNSPHRIAAPAAIPITVTRSTEAKPSLLEFYRINKPVLVESTLSHSRDSGSDYFQVVDRRSSLFPALHSERPLSIYLKIKHKLPPLPALSRLPVSSKPSEDLLVREFQHLRKQRDAEIERVIQSVRDEFELDQLQEAGLGSGRNVFRDV